MSGDETRIPFNRPFIAGKELSYIRQAVELGHLAGNGVFTGKCQEWMEQTFDAGRVLLTHSCTAALEMAAVLCDVGPGDEVIMPSYTFVSSANAFVLRGATPKFIDIREDTLNLDECLLEDAITNKTKVILPVHYGGVACEMDTVLSIAGRHDLMVVEDAAQGVNATYNGRYLGTIGHLGAYSFHETKNFISGEGGAIVVNDEQLINRAEILREKGTDRSCFLRGEVDKYTWVDIGSSYLASELVAAFLYAQLEQSNVISGKRMQIYDHYLERLQSLAELEYFRFQHVPSEAKHDAHLFCIIVENEEVRDRLLGSLREKGIYAVFHYVPLHTSPMGGRFGYHQGDLPVSESIASRLLRLPFYFDLTREDQERIIDNIHEFFQ